MKNTVSTFAKAKKDGARLSMLTAYDYTTASLVDAAGVNGILVGDSLGMTMLGLPDTLGVTMDDMVHHTRAVARGAKEALVVADMPFMSYHLSCAQATENAGRLVKEGGAQAVKIEGGAQFTPEIEAITRASIPVMGHLGLTPQSVNAFGGFKVQGKSTAAAQRIVDDARALEAAGAFAVVLECIPAELARIVTDAVGIPTIGIGSGAGCDGQILVYQDMLGMFDDLTPKFARRFAEVGALMKQAFADYDACVKDGSFPAPEHTFAAPADTFDGVK
ncbi:3-methyl-2-oxobutanoate hydroxymethyltransferase [Adlercreutzia sp. ZJ242]|uniref:3-methyl-2-oxobutanoate hydroxymethyltransferase n=1 Tax=Adlercreutzia sp. ZJ242 TaxID=2709409 RepID=UPI0013EDDC6B|nr:3-methyl-2-oxobutanoate hydroxymethyltransferase [Adlercreutzia sp. ZJ242]